jgi:glutamate carboxypeptidase
VRALLSACDRERAWLFRHLRDLVACESPSTDRAALDLCAALLAMQLEAAGAAVRRVPAGTTADHLVAEWRGGGRRVLLLGHYDTVWPVGQLARMPLREEDGRLFGPGVYDMKGGLAMGMLAARTIAEQIEAAARPHVSMLVTSDEEVGSATSRELIERMARDHDAVFVLEPALPGGGVKTARKGVGEFEIVAHGVSSHAGADPGAGASAVHEIARQIIAVEALRNPKHGISVNAGVVAGGTRGNVVAERATAVVDVRISRLEDAGRVTEAFHALEAENPRVRLDVRGGVNRPPMERSDAVVRLFEMARAVAAEMGEVLAEGATGGASDGNFTAAIGVQTLDGLGAIGDGAHALHEHVVAAALPGRAALLAGLMARFGRVEAVA